MAKNSFEIKINDDFKHLRVGIIDYSAGNIYSVYQCFNWFGVNLNIIKEPVNLSEYDLIILPGVGAFASAIRFLREIRMIESLQEFIGNKSKIVFGICLGFQLMSEFSEEGNEIGLGWIPSRVCHIKNIAQNIFVRVPHIGWNTVEVKQNNKLYLLQGLIQDPCFYFAHSYIIPYNGLEGNVGITHYGLDFISLYERDNIFGVQFHPEKSYLAGKIVVSNLLKRVLDVKG